VRLGIRLQVVLALLGLLICAFAPLFVAVASLTRTTMHEVRESSARSLGRAVAAHVGEARLRRSPSELRYLLDAEIGTAGVAALGVYDELGAPIARVGELGAIGALPATAKAGVEHVSTVSTTRGPAIQVIVPGVGGAVAAILHTDEDAGRAAPLVHLVGLYTGMVALGLLVFAYIALTRLIIRPLDTISGAARRVAAGAQSLDVPDRGAAELVDLGTALSEMTRKLKADEQRMRDQIDELERRTKELREAQDGLIRSERLASVGRLAAGLAHEIGNPIAALLGLEDLLLQGGLDPGESRDFLVRMRQETERIHRVLHDLLDFARPASAPAGRDADKPGAVAEAINDVVALVRPQKSFQNITLTVAAPNDLPQVALGRERIMQVLLNLLMNAADATGARGRILLSAEQHDKQVRLSVEDDGPGVDPAIQQRLFEPFATTKEVGKGTGLGLAVCRGLVESVGGSIELDCSHRPGARFVVELPEAAP
jgi:two-component system, NtrC family, sensor kinase